MLYLDRLNLTRIPTTARMVQSLQFLSLVNNPLQYLAVGDLDFRSDLLVLGLQNTSLTTIQAGAFERANFNDTDIGLQANRLRALPVNTFQPLLRSMADNNGVIELGGSQYFLSDFICQIWGTCGDHWEAVVSVVVGFVMKRPTTRSI